MDKTQLGDRIKNYEKLHEQRLIPLLPIIVRLDGRSFSKFTKGMKRPFDNDFRTSMIETTKYLVEHTHAKIGYTQSDEISLLLHTDNVNGTTMFDGRVQKIVSNFAAMTSVKFLTEMQKYFPERLTSGTLPTFDARVFVVPSKIEAYNAILWRVKDAVKNSISMVAHKEFSHKELHKLNSDEKLHKLLTERGIDWNAFPVDYKQGTFVRKENIVTEIDHDTLSKIPANKIPKDRTVVRSQIKVMDMLMFNQVNNPIEVLFDGAAPEYKSEEK